jgi:hypothetical protein
VGILLGSRYQQVDVEERVKSNEYVSLQWEHDGLERTFYMMFVSWDTYRHVVVKKGRSLETIAFLFRIEKSGIELLYRNSRQRPRYLLHRGFRIFRFSSRRREKE